MSRLHSRFWFIVILSLLWLPAGCGYKGALYLPKDAPNPTHQTNPS